MSKGARTRERIIAQAAPVFNTYGFAGTSLRELTVATGLEKGGIYNHFASKEELALAAFDYAVEEMTTRYRQAMELTTTGAVARLEAMMREFQRIIDDPPIPGGCPLLNTAVEADDLDTTLREHARAAMADWLRLIGGTVKAGVRSGELRPDTNARVVATIMTSTLEGAQVLSRLYNDPAYLQRAVEHMTIYIHSLRAENSSQ